VVRASTLNAGALKFTFLVVRMLLMSAYLLVDTVNALVLLVGLSCSNALLYLVLWLNGAGVA